MNDGNKDKRGYIEMALMNKLSVKERKSLKAYVEEGSYKKAGMKITPYKTEAAAVSSVYGIIKKPNVSARMSQIFDSIGLTEHQIAQDIKRLTRAKKKTYFSKDGIVTDERVDPDHQAQLKAIDLATDIRGMKVSKTANLNLNVNAEDLRNMDPQELEYLLNQCNEQLVELEKEQ